MVKIGSEGESKLIYKTVNGSLCRHFAKAFLYISVLNISHFYTAFGLASVQDMYFQKRYSNLSGKPPYVFILIQHLRDFYKTW